MDYLSRQEKLADLLYLSGVDGLVITHLPNIRYLCGFSGSSAVLLFLVSAKSRSIFYTDGRYTQQAKEQVKGSRVVVGKKAALVEACMRMPVVRGALGFESEHLSFAAYAQVRKSLPARMRLKPLAETVEQLRLIKDADEVEQIRAAVLLGSSLFQSAVAAIRPGVAENFVAGELELQARYAGAEKMSFDPIVAAGPRSALPHGRASTHAIPEAGFIILDYGVILAGYCSDMTRTVHVGRASQAHRRMYNAVLEAQLASIEAVRPGVQAGEVDQAGRTVLKKAGYGAYFTHSTGHGVGIEVHEPPRLARGQTQMLAPGMVITIEPGIYIPEEGGVRIEDMVLVTDSGHEVLTPTTKDLIEL